MVCITESEKKGFAIPNDKKHWASGVYVIGVGLGSLLTSLISWLIIPWFQQHSMAVCDACSLKSDRGNLRMVDILPYLTPIVWTEWIQSERLEFRWQSTLECCAYLELILAFISHLCCRGTPVQLRARSTIPAASIKPYPNEWLTVT